MAGSSPKRTSCRRWGCIVARSAFDPWESALGHVASTDRSEEHMAKAKSQWLKKYTKLEYLQLILKTRHLHLGNPKCWPDKNDSKLIQLYSAASGAFAMRATCLTAAADRFHFWAIFGECEKGVCLWFDKMSLLGDIGNDQSLVAEKAQYRSPDGLRKLERRLVPFAKREQYKDECEFRILRVKPAQHVAADKFEFSASSLKRIYLNPWLSRDAVEQEKAKISKLLGSDFRHVKVFQNRTLRQKSWIEAAKDALSTSS